MASLLQQATNTRENNVSQLLNAKRVDREIAKTKCAFEDIRNASTVVTVSSSAVKKGEIAPVTAADYEIDEGYASSRPVDFTEAWAEKLALSDADIDRWIKALRDAREANPYDEIEPPQLAEPEFDDDDVFEPQLMAIAPPLIDFDQLQSGTSDALAYETNTTHIEKEQPNDSGVSSLNQSFFELEMSGDESEESL